MVVGRGTQGKEELLIKNSPLFIDSGKNREPTTSEEGRKTCVSCSRKTGNPKQDKKKKKAYIK